MLLSCLYLLSYSAFIFLASSRGVAAQDDLPELPTTTDLSTSIQANIESSTATAPSTESSTATEENTATKTQATKSLTITSVISKTTETDTVENTDDSTAITTSASTSLANDGALTGLPTLTGGYTILPPSVPPTQNAPYMQQSSLPEGTVFIVVGATLGFLAVSVLAWRMGVAWCLHRSVRKAAFSQSMSDTKAIYRTIVTPSVPNLSFYKYSDRDSSISLSGLGGKGGKRSSKVGAAQSSSNTANLFFSPTAGAAGTNISNGSKVGSSYFPAGYYSAGSSTLGNGAGQMPLGGPGISLSNLSVQSQGLNHRRSIDPSPPDSPVTRPESNRNYQANPSTLSLSQTNGGSDLAPSAYLDDLIDAENMGPRNYHNSDRQFSRGSTSTR